MADTINWPYDKVEVMKGVTVTGSEGERRVRLSNSGDLHDVGNDLYLDDIETIILCTGYNVNQKMLSKEVSSARLVVLCRDISHLKHKSSDGISATWRKSLCYPKIGKWVTHSVRLPVNLSPTPAISPRGRAPITITASHSEIRT